MDELEKASVIEILLAGALGIGLGKLSLDFAHIIMSATLESGDLLQKLAFGFIALVFYIAGGLLMLSGFSFLPDAVGKIQKTYGKAALLLLLILGLAVGGLSKLYHPQTSEKKQVTKQVTEPKVDILEEQAKIQKAILIEAIEEAKRDAERVCREMGGNITTVRVFMQTNTELPTQDPEYAFYKVRNYTKTLYEVCVVGDKVYKPICEFEGCSPVGCGFNIEYHCFAPEKLERIPASVGLGNLWTIRFNETIGEMYLPPHPGVSPASLAFKELRYAGEVYSGQPLGEEIIKIGR